MTCRCLASPTLGETALLIAASQRPRRRCWAATIGPVHLGTARRRRPQENVMPMDEK
jgi:hypothetical protein